MRAQLEALGLTEVTVDESPDLRAFSLISTRDETGYSWECAPGGWYGYWGFGFNPCGVIAPVYDEYVDGTVTLGLVDPKLQKVVFGGVATGVIEEDERHTDDEINKAVREIFDRYPETDAGVR